MKYTLHIEVRSEPGGRKVYVRRASEPFDLGPFPLGLDHSQRGEAQRLQQRIADSVVRWVSVRDHAREVGEVLFNALVVLNGETENLYRSLLAEVRAARRRGEGSAVLELSISFDNDEFSELSGLPWEMMYDPRARSFISATGRVSVTRRAAPDAAVCDPDVPWRPPLRLLVVCPSPSLAWERDAAHRLVTTECHCVDALELVLFIEDLRQRCGDGLIEYKLLAGRKATPRNLMRELRAPHDVFLFAGHGFSRDGDGFILLEDGTSNRFGEPVSASEFADWVSGSTVFAAVFASCDSLHAAEACSAQADLNAAIGMQTRMPMVTAMPFAKGVLEAMAAWQSPRHWALQGRRRVIDFLKGRMAVYPVRGSVDDADAAINGCDFTHRPDWAIPANFVRGYTDSRFFRAIPEGNYGLGLGHEMLAEIGRGFGIEEEHLRPVAKCLGAPRLTRLEAFRLGRWPVTNHQYRYFLDHMPDGFGLPSGFRRGGEGVELIDLDPSAPVVGVTWHEAKKFCRWAGGRLPSADEWEAAARGLEGKVFAWGDLFDRERCSPTRDGGKGPVSTLKIPGGASPFGVEDMCGNVFEWTVTKTPKGGWVIAVGGSYRRNPVFTLPSLRCPKNPDRRLLDVGFRCAM